MLETSFGQTVVMKANRSIAIIQCTTENLNQKKSAIEETLQLDTYKISDQ